MRFKKNSMFFAVLLVLTVFCSTIAIAGDCDWCVCKSQDTFNACKSCCSSVQNIGYEKEKADSLGLGGSKSKVTIQKKSESLSLPISKWETGVVITKDEKTGSEIRQEFKYPIIDYSGSHILGDNSLCWQVCKDACDGYGVCHTVCWWKCASQGGEGDPRKK